MFQSPLYIIVLFAGLWKVVSSLSLRRPLLPSSRVKILHASNSIRPADDLSTITLKGFQKFVRTNPQSDKFLSRKFHHVEFYTGEASAVTARFALALGLDMSAASDFSTGNDDHVSLMAQSEDVRLMFTAPSAFVPKTSNIVDDTSSFTGLPCFNASKAREFIIKHGLGVRALAIEVDNVTDAYNTLLANGGRSALPPSRINDDNGRGYAEIGEVELYGDTVLRLVNADNFHGSFLPNFRDIVPSGNHSSSGTFGIRRIDHAVGNVWKLAPTAKYVQQMTGFHDFAEFVAEDVGTLDSGLNSMVLANNNEFILLPINEPTFGTKRKSQIQTYLEQYQGEGVQHIALLTDNIFQTLAKMKAFEDSGIGFSFQAPPDSEYYTRVVDRLGGITPLTEAQFEEAKKFGVLIDRDDQGMLLQIFTKPIGDRPTLFLEVIQRIGCVDSDSKTQRPGCGGFGKGNFKDLFRSIEEYEKSLGLN